MKRACIFLFLSLLAAPMYAAEPTPIYVLYANDGFMYSTNLTVIAKQDGTEVTRTDIPEPQFVPGGRSVKLDAGQTATATLFPVSAYPYDVMQIQLLSGQAVIGSELTFNDGREQHVLSVPTLPAPIAQSYEIAGGGFSHPSLIFRGVTNLFRSRHASIALFVDRADSATDVTIDVFDGAGKKLATEATHVEGRFAFYALKTPVDFGTLVVRHVHPPYTAPVVTLDAVAFSGYGVGAAGVIVPEFGLSVAIQ